MTRRDPDNGLRALFHGRLRQVHWQGVELGLMGSGCPDTNGCVSGAEFWIEFKYTTTSAVGLETEQVGWILRRMRAGGRVFVVTEQEREAGPRRGEASHALWIHEGWDAGTLRANGLDAVPPVLRLEGRRASWDWELILRALTDWVMSSGRT